MDKYNLDKDVKLFCVTAKSFPEGIVPAHDELIELLPTTEGRHFYGISYCEGKTLVYKAGVEESYAGEAEKYGCQTFIVKKGEYVFVDLPHYYKNIPQIGETFKQLLAEPGIDPSGCCVEVYLNDTDMRCMVRLDSQQNQIQGR
jgi:hypothetical protein